MEYKRISGFKKFRSFCAAHLLFFLLLFVFCAPGLARTVNVTAHVDKHELFVHDQLILTVNVTGDGQNLPDPAEPEFKGFNLADVSSSNSFSFVNGTVTSSIKKTYVLVPVKEGTFTIKPVPLPLAGVARLPGPITVKVLGSKNKGYSRNSSAQQGTGSGGQSGSAAAGLNRTYQTPGVADFFVDSSLSKKKVFVNEQITLTFKFYRAKPLYRNPDFIEPKAQGFTMELLSKQSSQREVIKGKTYQVEIIKYALFPLFSGKSIVEPAQLTLYERVETQQRGRSPRSPFNDPFFDDFFSSPFSRGRYERKRLVSAPIEVEVLPLPQKGKPDTEVKSIGSFNVSGLIDKQEVKVNEALALKVIVSGYGMVKTIKEPDLVLPNSFTKYDSKVTESSPSARQEKIFGSKTFEYVLIPQKQGDFTVGPVTYNYFDPEKKMYETASTPEFKVKVNPGENQPVIVSSGVTKKNVELISDDISFIKTGRNLMVNRSEKPWQKKGFWSSLWITFLLFIICVIVRLYHEKVLSDPVLMRRRGALPKAYKEISRLESSIENLSVREFYSGLSKIVINFIGDRLNLAGAGLTVDEIKNILEKTNIQNSLIKDTIEILEECDLMAFSSMNRSRDIKNANIKKCRGLVSDLSDLAFSGQDAPAGSQGSKSGKNRFFILFVLAFMFFIFLTGLFTGPAFASRAEMFFEQANRLYKEKKFEDALKAYAKIIRDEKTENETVYFNMGNCAFRLNQLGRARFFYEKALQFKPDDRDVNKNLTYLMLKLEDKIEAEKKSFLETLMESWTGLFSHAFLSNVLLTLIHLFLIVLSIRVFTRTRKNRRRIFVSAFLILLFIFTAAVTLAGKVHIERTDNFGIVTVERLSVHAEPELSSKIKFSLHQGAKIRIEAMQGLWYRISLPNGFFGWVEKARVDKL